MLTIDDICNDDINNDGISYRIKYDLGAHSGYISTLPHTRRMGSFDIKCGEKTMVVVARKGFSK